MERVNRFLICAYVVLLVVPLAGAQSYMLTNLGTLGGPFGSFAVAINNDGQVVGYSYVPTEGDAQADAFLWTPQGHMHDLLLGASSASGINDSGQIVGSFGATYTSAFLWTKAGGLKNLGTLGGNWSGATGINASGDVVGTSTITTNDDRTTHPFLWTSAGGMQDLGTFGGTYTSATGINRLGEIVGAAWLPGDQITHAFVWTASDGMQDLGTLGGSSSYATAINDSGVVVGNSNLPGDLVTHAFIWTKLQGMRDLGTLGGSFSNAIGINNSGQIVGWASTNTVTGVAFLWTKGKGMENLNRLIPAKSDWYLPGALAINRAGQIVGAGLLKNQYHAYLLTPINSSPR